MYIIQKNILQIFIIYDIISMSKIRNIWVANGDPWDIEKRRI